MGSLKLLTQKGNQATYIKILFKANEFIAAVHDDDMN